jgi:hypothetical protein
MTDLISVAVISKVDTNMNIPNRGRDMTEANMTCPEPWAMQPDIVGA